MQQQTSGGLKIKKICLGTMQKAKHVFIYTVVPYTKKGAKSGYEMCRRHVFPRVHEGTQFITRELVKIHKKQDWFKRFKDTFVGNAIGMAIAMFSADLIDGFIEVESMQNLWGLFSSSTTVSETTYKVIAFSVELFVALVVFSIIEYYVEEHRQLKDEDPDQDSDREYDHEYHD